MRTRPVSGSKRPVDADPGSRRFVGSIMAAIRRRIAVAGMKRLETCMNAALRHIDEYR
jgi:hypothetical protein